MPNERTRLMIINIRQIERELKKLDPRRDQVLKNQIRGTLRKSLQPMAKKSKAALKAQGSIVTGNLYRAITVKGRSYRSGYYSAALGARAKRVWKIGAKPPSLRTISNNRGWHLHFPNSGTKKRWHKSGHYTGKVPGKNSTFKIGFMDKVIIAHIPSAVSYVITNLNIVIEQARLRMNT